MRGQVTQKCRWSILVVSTAAFVTVMALLAGCYDFKIDTVEKWCNQIGDVNIEKKYRPAWALILDADAIRDDFVALLNNAPIEKVANRSPRMAWREGTVLHLINRSTRTVIERSEIIDKWREGIEKAKTYSHQDRADACLYGTVTSLFDSMKIHSIELDVFGNDKKDEVTTIETDRAARAAKVKMKPL